MRLVLVLLLVLAASEAAAIDLGKALGGGMTAAKGLSISDDDVRAAADRACAWMDAHNAVAPAGNAYAKLTSGVTSEDGIRLDYKVYLVRDVNAFAMANGCVRVFAGLMDKATDDEIRGVLGHEIGHAKLGHMKAKMKTAYLTRAARQGAAATGGAAGQIAIRSRRFRRRSRQRAVLAEGGERGRRVRLPLHGAPPLRSGRDGEPFQEVAERRRADVFAPGLPGSSREDPGVDRQQSVTLWAHR